MNKGFITMKRKAIISHTSFVIYSVLNCHSPCSTVKKSSSLLLVTEASLMRTVMVSYGFVSLFWRLISGELHCSGDTNGRCLLCLTCPQLHPQACQKWVSLSFSLFVSFGRNCPLSWNTFKDRYIDQHKEARSHKPLFLWKWSWQMDESWRKGKTCS